MSKALLIKSYTDLNTGTQGDWNELTMARSYIQGIRTGKILEGVNAEKIGALISGVPTPWARAKLFKFALDTLATPDPNIGDSGLTQYYDQLHGEWRGLLALLALHGDRISFSHPVVMDVRGGDYRIASAFGRMLFSDSDLWSDQDELSKNPDAQPYIQLIKYRGHLVGGTSPLTGCFTGVDYTKLGNDASDISWYRNGKLEDPMDYLNPEQLEKLYLFVRNMNSHLQAFADKVNALRTPERRVDLNGFMRMCQKWEDDIQAKAQSPLRQIGPVAQYPQLKCPFSVLFESNVPVYLTPQFSFTYQAGDGYTQIGDVQNLLSTDSFVVGWAEDDAQRRKLINAPVYFLRVKNLHAAQTYYFTLPLSEMGMDIFRNRLSDVLDYTAGGSTHLSATINDAGQLSVKLIVSIDGQSVALNTREYNISWLTDMGKVILWPDFVSDEWDKYYLYSEFTADAAQQFQPLFRSGDAMLRDGEGHFLTPLYQPQPDETPEVDIKHLVSYPAGQPADLPKYNIFAADKPVEGLLAFVKQNGRDVRAGYLMLRHSVVKDLTQFAPKVNAVVGVDFGSNNTCVYYRADDRDPEPVKFENYRSVLVGQENIDGRALAGNDELLFFTNYPAPGGQLKSWLQEHDSRCTAYNQSEEIAGGVPVNRPNVDVREMDAYKITTQAGILHYNMKWLDDAEGLEKKKAYLKSLWLQTCAYLYKQGIKPQEISWSHPGSMMESDVAEYEKIFGALANMKPYTAGKKPALNDKLPTEAEAVCSFALSQDFGLSSDNMFLGIDVGGSTSDILLLAKNSAQDNKRTLYRESSVRLAAGVFFGAVIESETFRRALVNFHESNQKSVYVANIKDILSEAGRHKAPYYLNNIFDQLKTSDDYDRFYESVSRDAKFVFTIPAYVTGLLLFYSGMLIGKAIKEHHLDQLKCVEILCFGKGGRIFHWLRSATSPRLTREYYARCLNAGVNLVAERELEVKYRDEIEVDNKAEVAKGLCAPQDVERIQRDQSSDICGERGVTYREPDGSIRQLAVEDELTGDYFANDMNNFDFKDVSNFETFMNIFIEFVSQKTKLYPEAERDLRADLQDLRNKIANLVTRDREYVKAKKNAQSGGGFRYHQPIIIAEGISFLDTLIRKAFNQ